MSGGVFIGIAVLIYIASFSIKKLFISRIGAAFVPQLAAIILLTLSVLLIIQTLLKKEDPAEESTVRREPMTKERKQVRFSVLSTIGLLIVYAAVLQYLGFILSTILYLFTQMIVLAGDKKRNYVTLVIISVVASTGIYALFVYGLELMLPAGILG